MPTVHTDPSRYIELVTDLHSPGRQLRSLMAYGTNNQSLAVTSPSTLQTAQEHVHTPPSGILPHSGRHGVHTLTCCRYSLTSRCPQSEAGSLEGFGNHQVSIQSMYIRAPRDCVS